jgi:tetratricopeptide (TPR) repeat protein
VRFKLRSWLDWATLFAAIICVPITLITAVAVLTDACHLGDKNPITLFMKISYLAALILIPLGYAKWRQVLTRFARLPNWLALRAKYQLALICNQFVFYPPGYRKSQKGWILFEAGQFDEAIAIFKPLAFDEGGKPRSASWDLFFFGTILVVKKDFETAQILFEPAANAEEKPGKFHMALADCLLAQRKEVDRARVLIEKALASTGRLGSGSEFAETTAKVAMHAFSLANCRMTSEAETRLQEALRESEQLGRRDRAGLDLVAGLTWRELGNLERARAALLEAKRLWPFGELAMRVDQRLAEMNGIA